MKLKITHLLTIILITSVECFAQTDTLTINNEKISCSIKEITEDAVKFSYPGEDLINTVYKNTVQKIVFKNGRIQKFVETTSFKKVSNVDDYENVTMTAVESEVKGLFKLGDLGAKAKGTTTLSNQERVKERAYRKMKIEAAMMGANIVYLLNQRSEGNKYGGYFQSGSTTETSLTGVAYTNQLPNLEDFKRLVNNRSDFITLEKNELWSSDSDVTKTTPKKEFKVFNIINDNGIITIVGQLAGVKKYNKFRLSNFTEEYFSIFYKDKSKAYNYKIGF